MMSLRDNWGCIVLLIFLHYLASTNGVELLPYGPDAGDLEFLEREDDEILDVAFNKSTFTFNGVPRSNVTIDDNGNVNFESQSEYSPDFPNGDFDVIGVLWDDLDPANVSPDTHVYYRETMDQATLFIGINGYDETTNTTRYDTICTDNDEATSMVQRKQSICQGQPGIVSFRTDEIENLGVCRVSKLLNESGCSSDADCVGASLPQHCPRCNTAISTCVECLEDGHCTTPEKQYCDMSELAKGWCMQCTSDDHCEDPSLPICDVDRMCKECVKHKDCKKEPLRVCSVDFRCIECLQDVDCRDPSKPVCDGETCVCLTDNDCDGNRVCDSATRQCVCPADNSPCNGTGMACDANGQCACLSGYRRVNGDCTLDCDPPCQDNEICSLDRKCLKDCVGADSDNCPYGTNPMTLRGCVKRGRLGGSCVRGRCFERNVGCNRRTNRCECRGRCKAKLTCQDRY